MEFILCDESGVPLAIFTSQQYAKNAAKKIGWEKYSIIACERFAFDAHWIEPPPTYKYDFPQQK